MSRSCRTVLWYLLHFVFTLWLSVVLVIKGIPEEASQQKVLPTAKGLKILRAGCVKLDLSSA